MAFIAYFLARADVLVYFSIFIALFIFWLNGIKKSTAKMPPGPMPLPVIGNLHMVDLNRPHESLMKLSEKYGEIFTLHFGPKKMVILAGYKIVKEALVTRADDFGERAISPIFKIVSNQHGIIYTNGEEWKSMRRFTVSALRDFGMGKKSLENRIQDELIPLIESFKSHNGKPFNTHMLTNSALSNVICSIIFGKRFEYDDPMFQKLINMLDESVKLVATPKVMLYNYYPFLGSLLGLHKKIQQNIQDVKSFISNFSKNRRLDFNANDITGYIDAYLKKQEQKRVLAGRNDGGLCWMKDEGLHLETSLDSTKTETYFNDENLISSVLDLFAGGTETVSTTIQWGILLMMKYPEIQSNSSYIF
ncbi:unnamed protein product [Ranitomeya imitator]|uniref:Cytochrome P450 n=1 Tax=Ranitomeya imitator TaxID=111125 RepID=A0ABN9KUI7_9NEOB|nr:unnamed protein product [Ranitomeya imitator]